MCPRAIAARPAATTTQSACNARHRRQRVRVHSLQRSGRRHRFQRHLLGTQQHILEFDQHFHFRLREILHSGNSVERLLRQRACLLISAAYPRPMARRAFATIPQSECRSKPRPLVAAVRAVAPRERQSGLTLLRGRVLRGMAEALVAIESSAIRATACAIFRTFLFSPRTVSGAIITFFAGRTRRTVALPAPAIL